MSSLLKIYGTTNTSAASTLGSIANVSISNAFRNIGSWFQGIGSGSRNFNGKVMTGAVQATGTITFSSLAADDTVTVNGVIFTAKVSPSGTNQFALGASDTAAAANFAAKINASGLAKIVSVVSATSALGVVTLTSIEPGLIGNVFTTAISAHGSVSGSGYLASGTNGTSTSLAKGN